MIEDVAGASIGDGTGTGSEANVRNADLLFFTVPAGPTLRVTSAVGLTGPPSSSAQNITTVNGVAVPDNAVVGNTPDGYTLTSQIVLSGVSAGSVGVGITASSTAALTPEPGSLAIWSLGAIGLLVAVTRRRRSPNPASSGLAA